MSNVDERSQGAAFVHRLRNHSEIDSQYFYPSLGLSHAISAARSMGEKRNAEVISERFLRLLVCIVDQECFDEMPEACFCSPTAADPFLHVPAGSYLQDSALDVIHMRWFREVAGVNRREGSRRVGRSH